MTALETVAHKIDQYAGAAGDVVPPVGNVSIPLWMLAELRKALKG